MRPILMERNEFAKSIIKKYIQHKNPLDRIFLYPMFFYTLIIFILYIFDFFEKISSFKYSSFFILKHIPLINYYNNVSEMGIASMYSFFVIGIILITIRGFFDKRIYFFPFFGSPLDIIRLLFSRVFTVLFFGLGLYVCLSDMMVSVQHRCPEIYKTARECMNIAATPEQASPHHIILMMMSILFWFLILAPFINGSVPHGIRKKYTDSRFFN